MSSGDQQQHKTNRERARRPRLPVREIIAAAARAGRSDPWQILAVAIAVSAASALLDIVVTHFVDETDLGLIAFGSISSWAVTLLGTVLLSGFLCRIVSTREHAAHGQAGPGGAKRPPERPSIRHVARTLPWSRLVRADILVTVLAVLGLLALLVGALVVVTLFAVVGPVIEIEERKVSSALRRSAHLVRQHFWWVALLVLVPLQVASLIELAAPEHDTAGDILAAIAIRGIGEGVAEAVTGLIVVELCYRLIALDVPRRRRNV